MSFPAAALSHLTATHPALIALAIVLLLVLLLGLPATYLLFAMFGRPVLEVIE